MLIYLKPGLYGASLNLQQRLVEESLILNVPIVQVWEESGDSQICRKGALCWAVLGEPANVCVCRFPSPMVRSKLLEGKEERKKRNEDKEQ